MVGARKGASEMEAGYIGMMGINRELFPRTPNSRGIGGEGMRFMALGLPEIAVALWILGAQGFQSGVWMLYPP